MAPDDWTNHYCNDGGEPLHHQVGRSDAEDRPYGISLSLLLLSLEVLYNVQVPRCQL